MTRVPFLVFVIVFSMGLGCAGAPPQAATPQVEAAGPTAPAVQSVEPVPASEAWRVDQPAQGPVPALVIPDIQQATLPNGLTVLVVEQRQLPLVHVRAALRGGVDLDPAGRLGLANLVYEMLPEGAGDKDAVALAEAFGELGTQLGAGAFPDGGALHCTVLERNLEPALALLGSVVQKPRFEAKNFERRKKKVLADLVRKRGEPRYLGMEGLIDEVFGAAHPYGHMTSGTVAGVEAMTLGDIKSFHAAHFGPQTTALIFAGDITLDEAKKLAMKQFGRWKHKVSLSAAPKAPAVAKRTRVRLIPKTDLDQSVIVLGRPGLAAGEADEWALEIANAVFGGMFSSRLNMNLREEKGVTYGAFSWLDSRLGVGFLGAMSPVDAAATGLAVKEVFKELDGLRSRPITEAEFLAARENQLRSLSGWFETVESLGSALTSLFCARRPLDHWKKMAVALEKLTFDQVRAAATRYFDPQFMKLVLVGDPKLVSEQLADQNLGPLSVEPATSK